ncbi:hypothetical protein RJ639_001567 [Escallonia herrerae]|uniref:Leucine-rich repeat-containing N-terminal plant-type domain-containing protein n=1 Tax=Escallonia herrerae TaxID=1293975 RepID=A0AA88XA02_9ASTE|nr:hypothetical protein RJ639_001567 [Escallonia herrerae]
MLAFSRLCILILCFLAKTLPSSACTEGEREALLRFKLSLTDPAHRLSSWMGKDCCKWTGVACDGTSPDAHVVKLDLQNLLQYSSENKLVGHELNSSLLELKYLEYLDLSQNNFEDCPIPVFLGSMKRLIYLNLSSTYFTGVVPSHLGNLSSLRVLDLSSYGGLVVDDLSWLSRLSSLHRLDMSTVNVSEARNVMTVINMLPSLLWLSLSVCELNNIHLSDHVYYMNNSLRKLQHLDLSANFFEGKLPYFLSNMTSLSFLDLSYNKFSRSVPRFLADFKGLVHLNIENNYFDNIEDQFSMILWNRCHLKILDISDNQFQGQTIEPGGNLSLCAAYNIERLDLSNNKFGGQLPDSLGQHKRLKYLDLHNNLFHGPIPASIGRLTALKELYLSANKLNGTIPDSIGRLTGLETLYLYINQLSGVIPASIGRLTALRELHLAGNELNGIVPTSLGQLRKLEILDMSSNSLEGVISDAQLANLSMLNILRTNSNFMLTFNMSSEWIPPFQLKEVRLDSCKLGAFPQWLRTQKELQELSLSNCSISGYLPQWLPEMRVLFVSLTNNNISGPFQSFSSNIINLYLSHNLISGSLPNNIGDLMPALERLLLVNNLLNADIPKSLCKMKSLAILDLSRNRLSGDLPHCWEDLHELTIVRLSSNRLSGMIPSSLAQSSLLWLQLNNNDFYGELPLALKYCSSLQVLDLGENGFSGYIPIWIGENFKDLRILRFHRNYFSGSIPSQLCQIHSLKVMDIGVNSLTGTIPPCLGNVTGMVVIESASWISDFYAASWYDVNIMEVIRGVELEYTKGQLEVIVNMDLSSNKLVGKIPEELTTLAGLLGLNLSHNHLSGSIPSKIGDLKSLVSLDISNNHLSSKIPQSMGALTSVSHLNLSYNNLSGPIPTGSQLQTLNDPSIYAGNSGLCGAPLPKCPSDEPSQPPASISISEEDEDQCKKVWFYVNIMSGFATGFWGVVGVLLFKRRWRHFFFRFVEATYDKILVAVQVRVARLKIKRNQLER